ncbi:septum formation protein Maf [bacterium]|nr:septum formation protein Maf [candidate division CSSED10-310 bacterium]
MIPPLILASGSPRRSALLERMNLLFEMQPAEQVESLPRTGDNPLEFCCAAAEFKAGSVVRRFPGRTVLGADTVVTIDGMILGKPSDETSAKNMLRHLSGRHHLVITALSLKTTSGRSISEHEKTRVHFRDISREEIEWYCGTGEGFDKAGGYGIQGLGAVFADRIEGCYTNIVGLPLPRLIRMLSDHAPEYWPPWKLKRV